MFHSNDPLPSVCSAAGIPLPADDTFDGIDLLPLLTGQADMAQELTKELQAWLAAPRRQYGNVPD